MKKVLIVYNSESGKKSQDILQWKTTGEIIYTGDLVNEQTRAKRLCVLKYPDADIINIGTGADVTDFLNKIQYFYDEVYLLCGVTFQNDLTKITENEYIKIQKHIKKYSPIELNKMENLKNPK